ncbi:MAG: efflux RND transporter permease subunit [Gammaproteobacteria bacterium]|nr:efflux RND transporter permease subunit [Gammaproteobacteria bacterium]
MSKPDAAHLPASGMWTAFEYMAGNRIAVMLATVALLALGIVGLLHVSVERYPAIDLRTVSIGVPYDGATPREVEEDINRRIEESLTEIDSVDRITSNAFEGRGEVLVEFDQWVDMVEKLELVRTAIDGIEAFPPENADEPEIVLHEVLRSVVSLVITSSTAGEDELRSGAEALRERLLLLPNVSVVDLLGARNREIQIDLDETQLRRHQLTIEEVVGRIRGSSINLTGGPIATESGTVVLSTLEKRLYGDQFNELVVLARPDGSIVRLQDIAVVRDSFVDDPLINTVNNSPAVFIEVSAPTTANPQDVVEQVHEFLSTYKPPPGLEIDLWVDRIYSVQKPLVSVANSGLVGVALVFGLLILLFDLRVGVWIAVGIPTAIVGSFIVLYALDVTMSIMAVIGFVIATGIVVDDAIIVGENIARHRESGLPALEASKRGAREVVAPVTVGVLTTMAAFAALLPLDGVLGQIFASMAGIVIVVLLFSLLDAFFLLPSHLSGGGLVSRWPLGLMQSRAKRSFQRIIDQRIVPLIGFSVRRPLVAMVGVTGLVAVAYGLFTSGVLSFNATGNRLDEQQLQLDLTMAAGSTFADSARASEQIVAAAHAANLRTGGTALRAVNTMVGRHRTVETTMGAEPEFPAPNHASVQLRLNTPPQREVSVAELKQAWIDAIGEVRGAERLSFPTTTQYASAGVGLVLLHADDDAVTAAAARLKDLMMSHPAIYEVDDTLELGSRRYEIHLTPAGRASGLTPAYVAAQLRHRFFGAEVQRVVRNQEELQVMTRYPLEKRASLRDLQDEFLDLPNGRVTALSSVVEIEESHDYAQRQRINGLPAATLTAYYNVEQTSSGELGGLVRGEWLPAVVREYPGLGYLPHGTSRDTAKALGILSITFPVALLVMFVIVTIQLRSVLQTFFVLASIPLAVAGAVYLHVILGYDFGLVSLWGVVAATGVVVNDALVLLDMYNRICRANPDASGGSAVLQAARLRARPILLTTITTVVGLLPLLYNRAESVEPFLSLVVSLIGGLAFAGIGLLVVLPAIVVLAERLKSRLTPAVDYLWVGGR